MRKPFALLMILTALMSHAESKLLDWCASLLPQHKTQTFSEFSYASKNFPPALRAKILDYDTKGYQAFAVRQTPQIAAFFFRQSPKGVFDILTNQYIQFLSGTGKEHSNVYNRLGTNSSPVLFSALGVKYSPQAPDPSSELFELTLSNVEKSHRGDNNKSPFEDSEFYKNQWHSTAAPKYRTLSGKEISAGAILREDSYRTASDKKSELVKSKIQFRSCYPREGRSIMKDVFARIDKLKGKNWEEAKLEYAIAMRGFFISTPLYSGTAGIGRIYFSALASKLSGRAVTLPADVDIYAMTLNQADFTNWILNEVDIF